MSVSVDAGPGAGGKRRAVNADLNLVPYIDLLTCMVAFLLITAVWSQLSRLEVGQKRAASTPGDPAPPLKRLAVIVSPDAFTVIEGDETTPIPRAATDEGRPPPELGKRLAALKESYPDRTDLEIASTDEIPFFTLTATIDVAIGSQFQDVSLVDAAPGG